MCKSLVQVYTTKLFHKWLRKERLGSDLLLDAIKEIEHGLIDADLGGGVIKKRVAAYGKGKRGGLRTLLAYRAGYRAFFLYGFSKNTKANISALELKALRSLGKELLGYSEAMLEQAVLHGELLRVKGNG